MQVLNYQLEYLCTNTECSLEDLPEVMDERASGKSMLVARHDDLYIYVVLFGPVKPESGVIPSGQKNSTVNI